MNYPYPPIIANLFILVTAGIFVLTNHSNSTSYEYIFAGNSEQSQKHPVNSTFFLDTEIGRKIIDYLVCIDLDCIEKLDAIITIRENAVPALIRLLQDDTQINIPTLKNGISLERVANALGKLKDTRAINPLIHALQNPSPVVRANIAAALGDIGDNKALPALTTLLQDVDQLVREETATALGNIGSKRALPALYDAVDLEPLPHVQLAMKKSIKKLENE